MFQGSETDKIFRQATESDIVMNAHKINRGETVKSIIKAKTFLFEEV